MKYITINNVQFQIKKAPDEKLVSLFKELRLYNHRGLGECYGRPSERKKAIYNSWLKWASDHCNAFGVYSFNSHFFTLIGSLTLQKEYVFVITSTHITLYVSKGDTLINELAKSEAFIS